MSNQNLRDVQNVYTKGTAVSFWNFHESKVLIWPELIINATDS